MTRLRNNGNLKYEKSYRDDCIRDDELADVVYLRSGDRQRAFGVITNRRANYYTLGEGECIDTSIISAPVHSSISNFNPLFQSYGSIQPESGNNRLRLRNMALVFLGLPKEYKIKYYSPYDQTNSIKEETRWAPQLTLEFPDLDTLDIVLFEVFPMGDEFKSKHSGITDSKEELTRESKKEKSDEVIVYPNPNNGSFIIVVKTPEKVKSIQIVDNLGKQVNIRHEVLHKNQYDKLNFIAGIYSVKVVYEDGIIINKMIIN